MTDYHEGDESVIDMSNDSGKGLDYAKALSAIFYGLSSIMIIVSNKMVLTSYGFPSYYGLALSQMIASVVVLYLGKKCRFISFPDVALTTPIQIFPLPIFYVGNLLTGLGGTKYLSLPMFTVLRRFSILMTMIGEFLLLSHDLGFNVGGYTHVLINDFMTAANGVTIKQKLHLKQFNKQGLIFYNNLLCILPVAGLMWLLGEFNHDISFLTCFLLSCIMGFILNYSVVLCIAYNSALTTTVVGCLKNIIVTYIGMFVGGDYTFTGTNFIGLTISALGSIWYSWVTFKVGTGKQ